MVKLQMVPTLERRLVHRGATPGTSLVRPSIVSPVSVTVPRGGWSPTHRRRPRALHVALCRSRMHRGQAVRWRQLATDRRPFRWCRLIAESCCVHGGNSADRAAGHFSRTDKLLQRSEIYVVWKNASSRSTENTGANVVENVPVRCCLLYTSPSPRDS